MFFGRTDAEAEAPILWPPHEKSWLIGKDSDAGRDWGQEEKGMTEDENGWMASLTRWPWVWVNSGSWWWTGRPGVLQFMGSQRVGYDWATELNWTRASQVAQWWRISLPIQEMRVQFLDWEDPVEQEIATHSSILFWKILCRSLVDYSWWGCKRIGHDLVTKQQQQQGWALIQSDWCPYKKRFTHTQRLQGWAYTHTLSSHSVRAQQEGCHLRAKNSDFRRNQAWRHLNLALSASRTMR